MALKRYKKKYDYSYCLGAFPSMELVNYSQDLVKEMIISEKLRDKETFIKIFKEKNISWRIDSKTINRISGKGNTFLMGVFNKSLKHVETGNHLVCDRISDMGNLGNIMRTMLAMGIKDLVTIGNSCDIYDPRTVRSSMGAIFHIRHSHFDSFEEYVNDFNENQRKKYFFILDKGAMLLDRAAKIEAEREKNSKWSLVFGNEGSGIDPELVKYGQAVYIRQSEEVDSLNLTTAVAIGLYEFNAKGGWN